MNDITTGQAAKWTRSSRYFKGASFNRHRQTDRLPSRLVTLKHHPYLSAISNRDNFFPPSDRIANTCPNLKMENLPLLCQAVLCRAF
ncbi:hypothetical protein BgiBS90_038224 [Biomphalaria glabrata]|nr:hypothetical protein BgiBS90_038224 [Biomphalaria glabrata]